MKLSESTLSILKNFSTINSGFIIRPGKLQKTLSTDKSIMAEVEFEDDFTTEFGIYDLNQFLGNVSALSNPDLEFDDNSVVMSDGTFSLKYYSCATNLIVSMPLDKTLTLNNPDVTFDMSNTTLSKILRLANMNGLPNISVIGEGGSMFAQCHDSTNNSSNYVKTAVGEYSGKEFISTFKAANLKMIPDDYHVEIKFNGFSKFTSKTRKLVYYVAMDVEK